jgi:hypothetical protein
MYLPRIFQIVFCIVLLLLVISCTKTKDLSRQSPYNQGIGKKFVLNEDAYVFKFDDTSQYSIAGPNSGIPGLSRIVDSKLIGKHRDNLIIKGVAKRGDVFTIIKVIEELSFEDSMIEFVIQFESSSITKEIFDTGSILNWKNYPFDKTLGDPPIFKSELVEPLRSDGTWWKQ